MRRNQTVDNRFVIPYCPGLLRIFNYHINVEVVSSVKSVKYLYKYVYKGYNAANIIVEESNNARLINHDEVRSFIETRYVNPVEACYHILTKSLQCKSHSIIRLAVQLPQQQSIIINDIDDDVAVEAALNRSSTLLAYFDFNKEDISARHYTYTEISAHYVFKQHNDNGHKVFRWSKRKFYNNCIASMYSVSPSQVELFRLRLLLLNCRGAKSFDELKNVNGVKYMTFSEACLALGLIDDDEEWSRAMQEAVTWMMPGLLFVHILIHCQPVHPDELLKNFKDALSEDFLRLYGDHTRAYNVAYSNNCETLIAEGNDIAKFPSMPQLVVNNHIEDSNELHDNLADMGNRQYTMLNRD